MIKGAFRHRIEIYRPATYDAVNEVESWKRLGAPRAKVKVLENVESTGNDYQATETVEFRVPYSRVLEIGHVDAVAVFRGREYEIKGVRNLDYADRELVILAEQYAGEKRIT